MTTAFAGVGAFPFAANSRDAAFLQGIDGARTISVHGTGVGVVLVEAYDTSATSLARLVNVSARNQVGTGDAILIAGCNISGTVSKRLLFRAIGPKRAWKFMSCRRRESGGDDVRKRMSVSAGDFS